MQNVISGVTQVFEGGMMVGDWIPVIGVGSGAGRGVMAICQMVGGVAGAVAGFFGGLAAAVVPGIFGYHDLSHWCFSWMRFSGNQLGNGVLNGFRSLVSLAPLSGIYTGGFGFILGITNPIGLFFYDFARGLVYTTRAVPA